MKTLLTLFVLLFSSSVVAGDILKELDVLLDPSSEVADQIKVPTVEKIFEEEFISIKEPFYGCIYSLEFDEKEDLSGTKRILKKIILGDKDQKIIIRDGNKFLGLEYENINLPKIGDCFAFNPEYAFYRGLTSGINEYAGSAEIYEYAFIVDENINKVVLKDKLTVNEYFKNKNFYGIKRVYLTGIVENAELAATESFIISLVSQNGDYIIGYILPWGLHTWKKNEKLKKQLRSIEVGKNLTVYGYFQMETPPQYLFHVLGIVN